MIIDDKKQEADNQERCQRCGTCCRQGGPALHSEDRSLLESGVLSTARLVTIRKAEPAQDPLKEDVVPAAAEFVKIGGQGGSWSCGFFEPESDQCRIYQQRPLECNLLFCQDTGPLEAVIGKDLLTRRDLLVDDDPVLPLVDRLDEECPYQRVNELLSGTLSPSEQLGPLTDLVRRDLALRQAFLNHFPDRESEELFLFGRPLFLVLAPYGFRLVEDGGDISLELAEQST